MEEVNGDGYTRRQPGLIYPCLANGEVVGGPLDGTWFDFCLAADVPLRMMLLPDVGIGLVQDDCGQT